LENPPLHLTRGSSSTPGSVVSPTETADPGAPRWQIRTECPPSPPRIGSGKTANAVDLRGGHAIVTPGLAQWAAPVLPSRPGSASKGWQGSRAAGRRIPGIDPGLRHPAALGTSAVPPCWGVHRLVCPYQPPRRWAFAAAVRSLKIMKTASVNDCDCIPPGCVEVSIQRRLTLQQPRGRYGGRGARDRMGSAMAPLGTKANPSRPRPHLPLPLARPTIPTNDGEGEAPGGVTRRGEPTAQTSPGRYAPSPMRSVPPTGLHSHDSEC
jgi:hypothetical protein